jgi:hypothetical protein
VRGAYGTTEAAHTTTAAIQQVTVYAEDDAATWAACSGVLADHVLMDLLCFYAEVAVDYIATVDGSITLDGAVASGDTTISLSDTSTLPSKGVLRINNEFIYYDAISGNDITNAKRGMYRTDKAAHSNGDSVLFTSVTHTLGDWRQGVLLKSRFEEEHSINEKIITWGASMFAEVWPNEDGEIESDLQAPPLDASFKDLNDDDIIYASKLVKRKEENRVTRVRVWYDPINPDPSDDPENPETEYNDMRGYIDGEAENANSYGERRIKSIFAEWLYNESDALWLAGHYWAKYKDGAPQIELMLETKDDDIRVGDLVRFSVPEIVDEDGAQESKFYHVISKMKKTIGEIKLLFEEAGFGAESYARIGPPNGVLLNSIDDSETTIDVDLAGTGMDIDDWATGGTHHIFIEDEKISYTTTTDLGSDTIRLSGGARGQDSTSAVAHTVGSSAGDLDVRMLYSAASTKHKRRYGFIGSTGDPPDGNLLDADGDFTEETTGYLFY